MRAACFAANRVGPHENNNAFFARIGQALLVNLPLLFWAYIVGNEGEILGSKCLLWWYVGYKLHTLFLLAPRAFTQERFFARLEFRKERTSFKES